MITLACDTLQIPLISGSKTVLDGMHPKVIEKAEERLEALGVILHCGAHIEKVEVNRAFLEGGKSVSFDFMIFTGGIISTSIVSKMNLEYNHIGQVLVDKYLRVPDREGVFAIGDAAEIRDKKGDLIPDTAQVAIKSGMCAAENIKLIIKGKKPTPATITINRTRRKVRHTRYG